MAKQKSLTTYKKKAWSLLSKIKRLEGADSEGMCVCYTCGARKHWKEMQAGHLLDGRSNSILFEENGIQIQCVGCNMFKSGNKEEFIPKFIKDQGQEEFDRLKALKNTTRKISISEYEDMIANYKERLNDLGDS